jgi:hypothetical protein
MENPANKRTDANATPTLRNHCLTHLTHLTHLTLWYTQDACEEHKR